MSEALKEYEVVFMPSRNWAAKPGSTTETTSPTFSGFLEKRGKTEPNRVDLQNLEAYMAELDRRGYTGTTKRRKASSVKSFFGFLKQYGYITNNVAEGLVPPAREYQALLRACS